MNKYELLFIVSTQYTDAEVVKIQDQVSKEVETAGGTIVASTNLGKIRLAYPIKKAKHGSYILVYFDADPSIINTLNRKLTLTDEVVRHTITNRPEGAEKKTFELTSYIAPLSEEAKEVKKERFDQRKDENREFVPRHKPEEIQTSIQPPTPSQTSPEESKMSIEELDKKLDELLDSDLTENI